MKLQLSAPPPHFTSLGVLGDCKRSQGHPGPALMPAACTTSAPLLRSPQPRRLSSPLCFKDGGVSTVSQRSSNIYGLTSSVLRKAPEDTETNPCCPCPRWVTSPRERKGQRRASVAVLHGVLLCGETKSLTRPEATVEATGAQSDVSDQGGLIWRGRKVTGHRQLVKGPIGPHLISA